MWYLFLVVQFWWGESTMHFSSEAIKPRLVGPSKAVFLTLGNQSWQWTIPKVVSYIHREIVDFKLHCQRTTCCHAPKYQPPFSMVECPGTNPTETNFTTEVLLSPPMWCWDGSFSSDYGDVEPWNPHFAHIVVQHFADLFVRLLAKVLRLSEDLGEIN